MEPPSFNMMESSLFNIHNKIEQINQHRLKRNIEDDQNNCDIIQKTLSICLNNMTRDMDYEGHAYNKFPQQMYKHHFDINKCNFYSNAKKNINNNGFKVNVTEEIQYFEEECIVTNDPKLPQASKNMNSVKCSYDLNNKEINIKISYDTFNKLK